MKKKIDYDEKLYRNYDEARRINPQMAAVWLEAARRYLPVGKGLKIADVGSGTGRFSEILASELGAEVAGVEPSNKMREVALSKQSSAPVSYMAGSAEKLPLADSEFDAAWLSMVIHHVDDIGACVAELRRILKPGGIVLIRNSFSGRLKDIPWYSYFPSAAAADDGRLPKIDELRNAFTRAGFDLVAQEGIRQLFAESGLDLVERMGKKGCSTFELISDEDYRDGLRRMEEDAKSGKLKGPITEVIDLLVFRKSG